MPRVRLFVAGAAIAVAATFAAAHPPHATRLTAGPPTHQAPPASVEAGALSRAPLEGIVAPVMEGRWYALTIWHAEMAREWYSAATRARRARFQRETPQRGSGGGFPGDCIAAHESGGNYSAQNPTSSASGKYQVLDSTWDGYAGYASSKDAPPAIQEQYARELWSKNPSAWNGTGCPGTG